VNEWCGNCYVWQGAPKEVLDGGCTAALTYLAFHSRLPNIARLGGKNVVHFRPQDESQYGSL